MNSPRHYLDLIRAAATPATPAPSNLTALSKFGHAVDMALFDLSRNRKVSPTTTENVRDFSLILRVAVAELAPPAVQPERQSTTTRGLLITLAHRDGRPPLSTEFQAEISGLALDCGLAATGTLRSRDRRRLIAALGVLAEKSLAAGSSASIAKHGVDVASATRVAMFAVAS